MNHSVIKQFHSGKAVSTATPQLLFFYLLKIFNAGILSRKLKTVVRYSILSLIETIVSLAKANFRVRLWILLHNHTHDLF
jgi:hypothetical protein